MPKPRLSAEAKRDIKRLKDAQKLLGRAAFLLGQGGAIHAMESLAEADNRIIARVQAILDCD